MATQQELQQASIQAAAQQQRLQQQRTTLTSQQALRTGTRQSQVQLKSTTGQISEAQQQLSQQQKDIAKASEEVKRYEEQQKVYEEQQAKYDQYQGGQQYAYSRLDSSGVIHGANLSGYSPEFIKGYNDAMSGITTAQSAYSIKGAKPIYEEVMLPTGKATVLTGISVPTQQGTFGKVSYTGVDISGGKGVKYQYGFGATKPSGINLETAKAYVEQYPQAIPQPKVSTTVPTYYVEKGLQLFGNKTEYYLSKVPGLAAKGTTRMSYPSEIKGTSYMTPTKEFYAPKHQFETESYAQLAGKAATVAPYFIPYVGESLLIAGGTEKFLKAPTLGGKILGAGEAGLGGFGLATRVGPKIGDVIATRGMKEVPASKVIAPEVLAAYEKKTGVKITPFPYDKPSTFKSWFEYKNVQQYGLPNIPKEVKGMPLGYSATSSGSIVEQTGIGEAGQFFSGKGVSARFLRLGTKYDMPLGQDLRLSNQPYVYALYGKNVKVVPKAYEIKVPNPYEVGGKPIKKYIFPNTELKSGTFYIPTNKPEVQAVAYGGITPIRKEYYFKLAGRRVPIGEYVPTKTDIAQQLISKGVKSESVSSSVLPYPLKSRPSYAFPSGTFSYSYTPYKLTSSIVSAPSSIVSSIAPSIPKSSYSYTPSSIKSSSYIPSPVPSISISSAIPSITKSSISKISTPPSIVPIYPPSSPPPKYLPSDISIYAKLKARKKRTSFEAFSKRFGKELSLGKFETQSAAESKLGSYLRGTLAASGKIKQEGIVLPFKSLKSFRSMEFRPAKRDAFTVVQARGFRLGTGSERLEIKRAKKKLKVW